MEITASELPSIVRLLDDENSTVRDAVKRKLGSYGGDLVAALDREVPEAPVSVREYALELQREYERDECFKTWQAWQQEPNNLDKLERGQILLSTILAPNSECPFKISEQLDQLADGFRDEFFLPDFRNLATHLFGSGMFQGDVERYYHPDNSDMASVLERRRGNPISLACVYILVGKRLRLKVGGCNYPAHLLARANCESDGRLYLIDCFNEGKVIPSEDLIRHHPLASHEVEDVVRHPASTEVILSRALRNLENAFSQANFPAEQAFMRRLRQSMSEVDV